MDQTDSVIERPADIYALLAIWAARDDQYARRPKPLTDVEVGAIIEGRKRESQFLPPKQRGRAYNSAKSWYPPEHGQ